MEFETVVRSRFSCRTFKKKKVTKKQLTFSFEMARLAPSAKNRQPWQFYVAQYKNKDACVEYMKEWANKFDPEHRTSTVFQTAEIINDAPVLIFVFKDTNMDFLRSDTLSIGAAVENFCLAATSIGIKTLWICDTWCIKDKIENHLNLIGKDLVCSIAVGYGYEKPLLRGRNSIKDIVKYED